MCVLVCFENDIYVFRCTCIYNMFSFVFIHAKIDIGMNFGSHKNLLFSIYIYIYIHLKQTLKWGSYTSFTFNMCGVRDAKGWEAPIYIYIYILLFFIFFVFLLFIYFFVIYNFFLFFFYLFIYFYSFIFAKLNVYYFLFPHFC